MDRYLTLAALIVLALAVVMGPAASLLPAGNPDLDVDPGQTPVVEPTHVAPPWVVASCAETYQSLPSVDDGLETVRVAFLNGEREVATATVEVADELPEWQQGLMNRTELPADGGMLFVFPDEERRTFWMKNTQIPLDIVFVTAEGDVVQLSSARPEPGVADEDLRRYNSGEPVMYAIELPAGTASAADIEFGTRVVVAPDEHCRQTN